MPRLFESDYLYGLHDPGGEQHMLDAGIPGWVLFTEGIGHDPNNRAGADYRPYSNRGLGIITRLNNGYYPNGTIPHSRHYADFAQRCANFVANSPGCHIWIIGNEPNYRIERPMATTGRSSSAAPPTPTGPAAGAEPDSKSLWAKLLQTVRNLMGGNGAASTVAGPPELPTPGPAFIDPPADDPYLHGSPERFNILEQPVTTPADAQGSSPGVGRAESAITRSTEQTTTRAAAAGQEVITPERYARCFQLCRNAIRAVNGHEHDQVIVAAVAPWNNQTAYPGNANGDWVQYFADLLALLGPDGCDGMALHTYTHGADANLITSDAKMNPPFANRHYEFRAYQDFMAVIPSTMRQLPVYITETDQDVAWLDRNIQWVQRAYGEINWWNQQAGNQLIRALILYRYPPIDKWVIQGKDAVIEDFRQAMRHGYRWRTSQSVQIAVGAVVATTDLVNLRRTPGFRNQSSNDVLWQMPRETESTVVGGPQSADGLTWWQVRVNSGSRAGTVGWTAAATSGGQQLLRLVKAPTTESGTDGDFQPNDLVRTTTVVRMRRTPGYLNQPPTDVITDIAADTRLTVLDGPRNADGLTWWQVRPVANPSRSGWMAQTRANGAPLLELVDRDGPTEPVEPPPAKGTFKKGETIETATVVRMRRTPGYTNKPANDVIDDIARGRLGTVLDGPRQANNLTWWQVRVAIPNGGQVTGWMAEVAPNGVTLLQKANGESGEPPVDHGLAAGDIVAAATGVRLRNSPGHIGKPGDDVLGDFAAKSTVNLIDGPRSADGLTWWRVGGVTSSGEPLVGWSAEKVGDVTLLAEPTPLPGTRIPSKADRRYLPLPFQGDFGIAQLWGENPQIYSQITYDGVPLRGHNGIDFLTPTGTPIVAIDSGVIEQAVYNDPTGFGHFIKVRHAWGEALYAHLSRIDVRVGQQIVQGNVLGATGNTGFTFGPHLHFAIRIKPYNRADGWGGFTDPLPYMTPAGIKLPSYVLDGPATRSLAQSAPEPLQQALSRAPGYAPDQPDVQRP